MTAPSTAGDEYRTHLALMDQIASTYSFNDNAQLKLNARIKNALDPKGILVPRERTVFFQRVMIERLGAWTLIKSSMTRVLIGITVSNSVVCEEKSFVSYCIGLSCS